MWISSNARRLSVVRRTFAVHPPCVGSACTVRERGGRLAPRALPVGLLLAFLLAAAAIRGDAISGENVVAGSGSGELENELEDEVDDAPFAIVVAHPDGWQCGGALVSMRTVLSSATCARGRGAQLSTELVARTAVSAPAAAGSRRVQRVAYANDGAEHEGQWQEIGAWQGSAFDLALLELESPFESSVHARPILMAATVEECTKAPPCHVVRTPSRPGALRVALVTPAQGGTCSAVASYWSTVAEKVMCLTGAELCQNDWGAGVVCAGKLCGVMSRSARAATGEKGGREEGGCGNIHAAQSMARWRNFLHCAHTLRACGRGNCATQCNERLLIEPGTVSPRFRFEVDPEGAIEETTTSTEKPVGPDSRALEQPPQQQQERQSTPGRTIMPPPVGRYRSPAAQPAVLPTPSPTPSEVTLRRGPEFEPGRPDFKAGEYGDNTADYGEGDEGPSRLSSSPPPPTHTTTVATTAPAPNVTEAPTRQPNNTLQQYKYALNGSNGAAVLSTFMMFIIVCLHM